MKNPNKIPNKQFKILLGVLGVTFLIASYTIHISPAINSEPYSKFFLFIN